MIAKNDIEIYNAFFQQKAITEKYLDSFPVSWTYSVVTYNADCTASVPFDLFDKVIVGILQVDEVLSIEQIGDILGMNLINDPQNFKYKDEAEYDVLRAAIDSLVQYKMVETGDIHYSSVKLTDIGKEYARKGMKFITTQNKEFKLYFDNSSGNHTNAKELFERYNPTPSTLKDSPDYLNDKVMKAVCEVQQPEIFNPAKGNSFTNPTVNRRSFTYDLKLHVALFFDIESKKFRLFCYEPETRKEIEPLTKWMNEHYVEKITDHYFKNVSVGQFSKAVPSEYLSYLKTKKHEFNAMAETNPVEAMELIKKAYREAEFVDSAYFWRNMTEFILEDAEEVYLFINKPSIGSLEVLNLLARSRITLPFFIVIQKTTEPNLVSLVQEVKSKCFSSPKRIFLLETDELKNFAVWIKRNGKIVQYKNSDLLIDYDSKKVKFSMLERSAMDNAKSVPICEKVKSLTADLYMPVIKENVADYISKQKEINENKIDLELIDSYSTIPAKAEVFKGIKLSSSLSSIIQELEREKDNLITYQTGRHQLRLLKRLEDLRGQFLQKEIAELNEVLKFKEEGNKLKALIPANYQEIIEACDGFIELVKEREKYIRDEILAKTFVIDTNVFIEEPNILELIDKKNYVALNFMVVEELDRLKTREKTKEKAGIAIKKINAYLQDSAKEKNPRVRKSKANLRLLPDELQNKSGDNYILAVAYAYKDKNPVILSNDNNLQVKAQMLEIPVMNLVAYRESIKQIIKK